jgi:sugar lactone lactonase YvrE
MHICTQPRHVSNLARFARVGAAAALLAPLAAACGGGGGDSDTCTPGSGDGTLMITITGHDPGSVMVEGVATPITTSGMVTASAGPHMITPARVTAPQTGITSQVFEGTVDRPKACVRAGATTVVTVTYALVPTSGKLWAGVGNAPDDSTMLGFAPASVAATGTTAADVATNTGGSDGFTFDRAGDMWVLGGTTADAPLARYRASTFASDGLKVPAVTIESPSFGGGIPGPKVVAFDPVGNLWVSVVAADKVIKFTPEQLAAGGSQTATVERTGILSPEGIAFDSTGNMWVVSQDAETVIRIDAAHLVTSGTGGDLAITAMTPSPVIGTLRPRSLAFDASGNLWVNYDGIIASITPAEQAGSNARTITPAIQIETDVLTLPVGIAFDQDGGLWLAHAAGKFARLGPTQLGASGMVTPSIVITSPDIGYASWFAMYPAPAGTPLYHKVP